MVTDVVTDVGVSIGWAAHSVQGNPLHLGFDASWLDGEASPDAMMAMNLCGRCTRVPTVVSRPRKDSKDTK